MKKLLMSLVLAVASVSSFAAISTDGLTEAQRKEIEQSVQKLKSENSGIPTNISANIRKEVSAWAEIGSGVGQAMVAAAKELGMAAATFAETPLGKITVAIVIFNVIGASIAKMVIGVVGLFIAVCVFWFCWHAHKMHCFNIKYEMKPILFGLMQKKYVVSREHRSFESGFLPVGFIALAAGVLCFVVSFANL